MKSDAQDHICAWMSRLRVEMPIPLTTNGHMDTIQSDVQRSGEVRSGPPSFVISPISEEIKLREVKWLPQCHTALCELWG